MPELPEVETIRQGLEKYLKGHRIVDVEVKNPKIFTGNPEDLVGGKIKGVRRFAKVLSIDLTNGNSIVTHLKMSGQFIYRGYRLKNIPPLSIKVKGGIPGKHTHVIFTLDHSSKLYYNDFRRFSWMKVIKTPEVETSGFIGKLGPEPFCKPQGKPSLLTFDLFKEILARSSRPIKVVIMDQEKIGGVGNIYANDALWLSKISPRKPAAGLNQSEVGKLYKAILKVLKRGLKWGGASELAFVTPEGTEGKYQNHTLAYGHEGDVCGRCHKGIFKKFFLGDRGTYFCPVCQK